MYEYSLANIINGEKRENSFTGGNSNIGNDLIKKLINKYLILSTYNRTKTKFKNKNFKQLKYNFKKKLILNKF